MPPEEQHATSTSHSNTVFTQRVHPFVLRCLALTSLALAIPAFAFAVSAFFRGGAHYLSATIAAALIGSILLGAAFCACKGAGRKCGRRLVECADPNSSPSASCAESDAADEQLWSAARVRWPLAICCIAIAALFLVPAAIIYAEWRLHFGVFELPTRPPPLLEFSGVSAVGVAFLSIAMGLLYRRHRNAVWGLLLFLVAAVGFVAYGLFFAPVK